MIPPTRQQVIAGIVAALLLLAGIGAAMRHRDPGPTRAHKGAAREAIAFQSSEAEDQQRVMVDVAGAVRVPGVYALKKESRVLDAIERAGGALPGAHLEAVNRAAPVVDGQQIIVLARADPSAAIRNGAAPAVAGPSEPASAGGMISLNSADATALDSLDGIGPITAQKIVDDRASNGPFRSIEDLDRVSGIGQATIESNRSRLTL